MKGYREVEQHSTKSVITNDILYKHLPYGKWTTANNEEYLFNRDYEPIMGWNLETNSSIAVTPNMWITDIINSEMYYGNGILPPTRSVAVLRKLWNILAQWSVRMHHTEGIFK